MMASASTHSCTEATTLGPGLIRPLIFDRCPSSAPRIRSVVAHRHIERPRSFDTRPNFNTRTHQLGNPYWEENLKTIVREGLGMEPTRAAMTSRWTHGNCIDPSAYVAGENPRDYD